MAAVGVLLRLLFPLGGAMRKKKKRNRVRLGSIPLHTHFANSEKDGRERERVVVGNLSVVAV